MFFHGSQHDLNIGDILVPGEEIGFSDNGGHSQHVYIVATSGYSLSEVEEGSYYKRTFDYAIADALFWGGKNDSQKTYVYVVEPLAEVTYDETDRYSPSSMKTDKARIVQKYVWDERISDLGTFTYMVEHELDKEPIYSEMK